MLSGVYGLGNKGCNLCSEKNPQLLEITEMRGGGKKKEKECWEESKSTNLTDGPHQQMPFVFDDVLNYILG